MMNALTIIVPNDAELFAISELAAAKHLHLVTNGKSTLLSPIIPAGWHEIVAKAKPAPTPRLAARAEDWLAPEKTQKQTQKESAIADVFFAPANAGEPTVEGVRSESWV